jgi:hypothetical protein
MVRASQVWCVLAAVALASAASARAFEKLPAGHPIYADLAVLSDAGLLVADELYRPGGEMTRMECALCWSNVWRSLVAQDDGTRHVTQRDGDMTRVADAMRRLLDALRPELEALHIDSIAARRTLAALPDHAASTSTQPSSSPVATVTPSRIPSSGVDDFGGGLRNLVKRTAISDSAVGFGGGRPNGSLGDPGGLQLGARPVQSDLLLGPSGLFGGHVMAADLRLRLGDTSVLVDYAESLFDQRFGHLVPQEVGRQLKAGLRADLGRLNVDLRYGRMMGDAAALSGLPSGGGGPLTGLEAGAGWTGDNFGLRTGVSLYRPDTSDNGYLSKMGMQITYSPLSSVQLGVAYQTSARRGLANLDDCWRNLVDAQVVYVVSSTLRANLNYRFDTGEQTTTTTPGPEEHQVGVSLGLTF